MKIKKITALKSADIFCNIMTEPILFIIIKTLITVGSKMKVTWGWRW